MAVNRRRLCLICYDIASPKRLARLRRLIARRALMVQYSVYLARLSGRELDALAEAIAARIDPAEDDVRIYPLPERERWAVLDETQFFGLPDAPVCVPIEAAGRARR